MQEVEIKADLRGLAPARLDAAREALGFQAGAWVRERDCYYNAPDRDFRRTDEALRLRRCTELPNGREAVLWTYKGPKLGTVSGARTEYETAVGDAETAGKLLQALGYRPVMEVDKVRRTFTLGKAALCLDEVAGLGLFLELEILVEDGGDRTAAEAELYRLLDRLGVSRERLTRRSYLELLLK